MAHVRPPNLRPMLDDFAARDSFRGRMSLDVFERAINEITDKDWSWWPFVWLRPHKHMDLSLLRLGSIALLYGLPCSGVLAIAVALAQPEARAGVPMIVVGFPLLFLLLGTLVVGPMWNRRAARLRARIRRGT